MGYLFQAGDLVQAHYKTGRYLGEYMDSRGRGRALVKVLAVLSHPEQGDLHQPFESQPGLFHQRRALAYTEKALVYEADMEAYTGDIPDYTQSLRDSLDHLIRHLQSDEVQRAYPEWAARSLEELEILRKDYFPQDYKN